MENTTSKRLAAMGWVQEPGEPGVYVNNLQQEELTGWKSDAVRKLQERFNEQLRRNSR